MASSHQYLTYYINLTDLDTVEDLQQIHVGEGKPIGESLSTLTSPDSEAVNHSAPLLLKTDPFVAPSITSEWFGTSDQYPTNVASFDRKSGGWFGWSWLFGNKVTFHWRGIFVYSPPTDGSAPSGPGIPTPFARRRWIDGFELPDFGEGGSASVGAGCARVASRHTQGFGFAMRSGQTFVRTHGTDENRGGAKPTSTWERLYIRPRTYPTATTHFWRCRDGFSESAVGLILALTPTGQIAVFSSTNANDYTLLASTAVLPLDVWVKLDVLKSFGPSVEPALRLLVNGVLAMTISKGTLPLAAASKTHGTSEIGFNGAHTLALDFDDWIGADVPVLLDGLDFQFGSAVRKVNATGFGAGMTGWAGDWQALNQLPSTRATGLVTSSTSGAVLAVTTDAEDVVDAEPGGLGCVALVVGVHQGGDTPGVGQVGYSLAGAAPVMAAAGASAANPGLWSTLLYAPVGAATPPGVTPLELLYHKAVSVTAVNVKALAAAAEIIGVYGAEDVLPATPPLPAPTPIFGQHNAPYPRTPWARRTTPPLQPVQIQAGTYVGTGAAQELAFSVPVHFLWVRPLTGTLSGGTRWWSTLGQAHAAGFEGMAPFLLPQALMNGTFVPVVGETVSTGDHTDVVARVKAECVALGLDLSGDCGAFEIIKRVAWQLRSTGAGLLDKPTGANCQGYATDIVCYADGSIFDVLVNAGTDNTPAWNVAGAGTVDPSRYRPAIDPGDEVPALAEGGQQTQCVLRLVGADAGCNAVGVVYAFLAVSDPGMRFLCNGALADHTPALDRTTALFHPTFTPEALHLLQETGAATATQRQYYKGPGHAAASASLVTAAETANAIVFGAGSLLSKAAIHYSGATQIGFSAWRMNDGRLEDRGKVCQITSYIGNGSATRSIAIAPGVGKRPLWALVVPHNGVALMRDPSHTGTTSTELSAGAANAATGIMGGGIDQIDVGIVLNANGIVYDVFVIPGSVEECGNNGWSCPGIFNPVPPEPPPGAPPDPGGPIPGDPPEPEPEPEPEPVPLPGVPLTCLEATTKLVNLAISRLGVSVQVVDLATELTPAAVQARLHYVDALEAVLRAFPWPFATRYATLALVAGTSTVPAVDDWQYAYRAPSDLLFGRRFTKPGERRRAYDPEPATFRIGSDATGPLIYGEVVPALAKFEYTARPTCAASQGDALFRSAFAWRLAHELAPTLCRDEKKVAMAWAMYERQIVTAKVAAANEAQQDQHSPDAPWITGRE